MISDVKLQIFDSIDENKVIAEIMAIFITSNLYGKQFFFNCPYLFKRIIDEQIIWFSSLSIRTI